MFFTDKQEKFSNEASLSQNLNQTAQTYQENILTPLKFTRI
jgi:hypothetical protein